MLRYDKNARLSCYMVPFGTIAWDDEHPGQGVDLLPSDEKSKTSILLLSAARTSVWLTGQIPEQLQELWDQARALLPEWPGFQRLALSEKEKEFLKRCEMECDSVAEAFIGILTEADEASAGTDETGILFQLKATYNLKKDSNEQDS